MERLAVEAALKASVREGNETMGWIALKNTLILMLLDVLKRDPAHGTIDGNTDGRGDEMYYAFCRGDHYTLIRVLMEVYIRLPD